MKTSCQWFAVLWVGVSSVAFAQRPELTPATPEATCEVTPDVRVTTLAGHPFSVEPTGVYTLTRAVSHVQMRVGMSEGAGAPILAAVAFKHRESGCLISVDATGVQYGSKLDCEDGEIQVTTTKALVIIRTPDQDVITVTRPATPMGPLSLRITVAAKGSFRSTMGLCGPYTNPPAKGLVWTGTRVEKDVHLYARRWRVADEVTSRESSLFFQLGEAQKRARGE
ncbi:hypothetical protein MYSTI_03998 [Myxococcus stipitatus DSM 14675]|uniref:Lipoprotein n=1 Tax=Myxococcus stipitatus (strain DSM 14675 / JCM 12634 / Mx s8) TaxID=1278073 RepID=L7UFR9_MYXSD|nr:hypothetical protein [Myxococcus stipitatus]AGC45299.1 hypothetical protein MYSTI_03998 [Myxococcus stipitatus DSM 14675]